MFNLWYWMIAGTTMICGVAIAYKISERHFNRGTALGVSWPIAFLTPFALGFVSVWVMTANDPGPWQGLPQSSIGRAALAVIWGPTPLIFIVIGTVTGLVMSALILAKKS